MNRTKGFRWQGQKLIGEAIAWAGIDKLVWGTDWSGPMVRHKEQTEFFKEFQIGEQVTKDYGYPPLTPEDKEKWAGGNLARLLKINVKPA